jgi:hypothetical protein
MSQGVGQATPRWSVPAQSEATVTWFMAELPDSRAIVCVDPPLFWRPAGLRPAGVSDKEVPLNTQLPSSSRLYPPSVIVPAQSVPVVWPATMVATSVVDPSLLKIPPAK